jgi:hypothetical protein
MALTTLLELSATTIRLSKNLVKVLLLALLLATGAPTQTTAAVAGANKPSHVVISAGERYVILYVAPMNASGFNSWQVERWSGSEWEVLGLSIARMAGDFRPFPGIGNRFPVSTLEGSIGALEGVLVFIDTGGSRPGDRLRFTSGFADLVFETTISAKQVAVQRYDEPLCRFGKDVSRNDLLDRLTPTNRWRRVANKPCHRLRTGFYRAIRKHKVYAYFYVPPHRSWAIQ